jgi:hypothetical protein
MVGMSDEPRSVSEALMAAAQQEQEDGAREAMLAAQQEALDAALRERAAELDAEEPVEPTETAGHDQADEQDEPVGVPTSMIAELRDALVGQEPVVEAGREELPLSSPEWNGQAELPPEQPPRRPSGVRRRWPTSVRSSRSGVAGVRPRAS